MAWYDLEEDDSTLTLDSPRRAASRFSDLGPEEAVDLPEPETFENTRKKLDEKWGPIQAAAQPSGRSSLGGVRLTPERTLGEEFSVGWDRGTDQLSGLAYGFVGLAADALGVEKAADWGYDNYRRAMEEAATKAASVQDPFEEIDDFGDAGRYAVGLLGEQIPQLLTSILGGGVGAAVGKTLAKRIVANQVAKRMAGGAVGQKAAQRVAAGEITREMAEREVAEELTKGLLTRATAAGTSLQTAGTMAGSKAAQEGVKQATKYGAMTGAYLTNLGQISGGTYGQVRDETGEGGDDAVMASVATSVPGAALDTLFQGFVVSKIPGLNRVMGMGVEGKPLNLRLPGRLAVGAAKGAAIGSALEGTTEYLQTGLEQAAVGMADPNQTVQERLNAPGAERERMIAGAAGATIGGMLGGGGGTLESFTSRTRKALDDIDGEDAAPPADPLAGLADSDGRLTGTWGEEIDVDGLKVRQHKDSGMWAAVNPPPNYPGTLSMTATLDDQKVAMLNPKTIPGAALLSRIADIVDGQDQDQDDQQSEAEKKSEPPKERLIPVVPEEEEGDQSGIYGPGFGDYMSGGRGFVLRDSATEPSPPAAVDTARPPSAIVPGGELGPNDRATGTEGRAAEGKQTLGRADDQPRAVFMPLRTAPPRPREPGIVPVGEGKFEPIVPDGSPDQEYEIVLGGQLLRGYLWRKRNNGDASFIVQDPSTGKQTKVMVPAADLPTTVRQARPPSQDGNVEAEFNERLNAATTTEELENLLGGYIPTGASHETTVPDNTGAAPARYLVTYFYRDGEPAVPTTKKPDGPPVVADKKLQPNLQDVATAADGEEFSNAVSANAKTTDAFIQNLEPGEYQVFDGNGEANGTAEITVTKAGKKRVKYLTQDGELIGGAKELASELNWARSETNVEIPTPKTEADIATAQAAAEAQAKQSWKRGSLAKISRDPVRAPKQTKLLPPPEPIEVTRQRTSLSSALTGIQARIKDLVTLEAANKLTGYQANELATLRQQEEAAKAELAAFNQRNPRREYRDNALFSVDTNGGVTFARPVYARFTPLLTAPMPKPAPPELLQPIESRAARTESAQARQALAAAGLRGRDLEEALEQRLGMTERELAEQEQAENQRIAAENEKRQNAYNEQQTNFEQTYNAFKAQVLRAMDAGHTVPLVERAMVSKDGRMTLQSGALGQGLIEFLRNDPDFTIEDRAPVDPKTGEAMSGAVPTITGVVWRGLDGKQRPWQARQGSKPASFVRWALTGETVQVQNPADWTLTPMGAGERTTPQERAEMRRTLQREAKQRNAATDLLDRNLMAIDDLIAKEERRLESELALVPANDKKRARRDQLAREINELNGALAGLAADLRYQPTATVERESLIARRDALREEAAAQAKRKTKRDAEIERLRAEYKTQADITASDRAQSSRNKASSKAATIKERLDQLVGQNKTDAEAQKQRTKELSQITNALRTMPLKLANEKKKLDVRRAEEQTVLTGALEQKKEELKSLGIDNKLGERIQNKRNALARLRERREETIYQAEREALAFDRASAIAPEQQFTKPLRGIGSFARVYLGDRQRRQLSEEKRLSDSERRGLKRKDLVQQFSQLPETQKLVFNELLGQMLQMFTTGSSVAARDRIMSQLSRGASVGLNDDEADAAVSIAVDLASNSAAEHFLSVVEARRAKGGAPSTLPREIQLELAKLLMQEIGNVHRERVTKGLDKLPTRAQFIAEVRLEAANLGISVDDVQEILDASPESAQALLDELRRRGTRQVTQIRKVSLRPSDAVEGPLTASQQAKIDAEIKKLEEKGYKSVRNESGTLTFTRRVDSKLNDQRAFYTRLNAALDASSLESAGTKAYRKAKKASAKAFKIQQNDVQLAIQNVLQRLANSPLRFRVTPATPDVEVAESADAAQELRDARLELADLKSRLDPESSAVKDAQKRVDELESNYKTTTVAGKPETRTPIVDEDRTARETRFLNNVAALFKDFYKGFNPFEENRKALDRGRKQVESNRPRQIQTQSLPPVDVDEDPDVSLQDKMDAAKTNPETKLFGSGSGRLPPALMARERAELLRSLPAQVRQDLYEITGLYWDPTIDRWWFRGATLGALEKRVEQGKDAEQFILGKRKALRKKYSPERLQAVLDAIKFIKDEEALTFFDEQRKQQREQPKPTIVLPTGRDAITRRGRKIERSAPIFDPDETSGRNEWIRRNQQRRESRGAGADAERTVGVGVDLGGVPDRILLSGISDSLGNVIDDVPASGGVSSAGGTAGNQSGSVPGTPAQSAPRPGRPNTLQPRTIRRLTPRATRIFVAAVTGKNVDALSEDEIDAIYRASDTQAKGGEAVLAGGNVVSQTPQNIADLLATANGFELLTGMALEEQGQARAEARVANLRKNLGDLAEARAFGSIETFLQTVANNPALPRKSRLIANELLVAGRRLPGLGWNDTVALQIAAFGRNFMSEPITNKELDKRVKLSADGTEFLVSLGGNRKVTRVPAPRGERAKNAKRAKLQQEAARAIALASAVPWSGKTVGRDGAYSVYLNLAAGHGNREAGAIDTLLHELIHPLIDSKLTGAVELNAVERAALARLQAFRREAVLAAAKTRGIDVPTGAVSDDEFTRIETALARQAVETSDQALKSLTDIKEFVNDVIGNPETAQLISELGFGVANKDSKYSPKGGAKGITGTLRSLWNTITTFITGKQIEDNSPLAEALSDAWSLTFKSLDNNTPTVVDRALNQSARAVSGTDSGANFTPPLVYRNALIAELERGIQQERYIRKQLEERNLAGTTADRNRIVGEFANAVAAQAQADPAVIEEAPADAAVEEIDQETETDAETQKQDADERNARIALFQYALTDTESEFVSRINSLKSENPDLTFEGFDDPVELYYVSRGQAAEALDSLGALDRVALAMETTPEVLRQISDGAEKETLAQLDAATIEQDERTKEWVVRSSDRQELIRTRSKADADAAYQAAVEKGDGPDAKRVPSLAAAARRLGDLNLARRNVSAFAPKARASTFTAADLRNILEQFKENKRRPKDENGQEYSEKDAAYIRELETDIRVQEKRETALRAAGEKAVAAFRKKMEQADADKKARSKPDTAKMKALGTSSVEAADNNDDDPPPGGKPPGRKKRKTPAPTGAATTPGAPFRGVNVEAAVSGLKWNDWKETKAKDGATLWVRRAPLTDADTKFWGAYNQNKTASKEVQAKLKAAFRAKGYVVGWSPKYDYYVTQLSSRNPSEVSDSLGGKFVTEQQDRDYLAAVERGDMETAQRMVDEAARAAGYIGPVWRGGRVANIPKFNTRPGNVRPGKLFFTNRRREALNYVDGRENDLVVAYLRPEETWDLEDGIFHYVVGEPNQIKSGEVITRDDQGNIIPLSQRFNPETPDISYSLGEKFERLIKSETIKTRSGGTYVKDPLLSAINSTLDARAREKFENRGAKINAEASRATSEIKLLGRQLKGSNIDYRVVTAALGNLDNPYTDEQMAKLAEAKITEPETVSDLEAQFRRENRQAARDRREKALKSLPRDVRATVNRMRDHLDVLMRRLIEEGIVSGDMEIAVDETYGIYLNRSYAIDDDPQWVDKVRKNKKVMADARRFLKKQLLDLRAEKIRRSAALKGQELSEEEVRRQAADSVTTADVEAQLENALARKKLDFMMSSIPGQKNMSVFMKRGVVAPEIQAVWGVYNSPDTAYGKTVLKLASLIHNHTYLRELRELGLSEGWFEAPPSIKQVGDEFIVRDSRDNVILRTEDQEEAEAAYAEAKADFDPPASYRPIAAEGNPRLAPLAGVHAMPELLNALYQIYTPETENAQTKTVGMFSKLTGYGMAAATVGSAQGQVRNYWGGFLKLLSVGTFFSLPDGSFKLAHKLAIQEAFKTAGADYKKTRAEIEKLIRLRIYGESVDANTVSSLVKDYNTLGRAMQSDDDTLASKIARPLLNTWDLAKATYSMSDNIMRTLVFYGERENYRKAFPKMSSEELDQKAAQLARDLFWTYSEAPEWVQNLKRGPGLVLAPFITFTTEVIRTAINTWRVAISEINSGNPELQAVGYKRIAGFATAWALPGAAAGALMAMSGLSSDDEEDLRKFLPKWQQNNQLLLTRGENGTIGYFDVSFLDGNDVFKKPLNAFLRAVGRAEDPIEATTTGAVEMLTEFWRPFFSEQLVAGTVASVLRNTDSSGRRIYNPQASGAEIAQAIASQFVGVQGILGFTGDGVFVPGTLKSAGRVVRGSFGVVTDSGQAIDPAQELSSVLLGLRARQVNLDQALGYSAGEYLRNMRDATSIFNRVYLSRGTQPAGATAAAFEQADLRQYELTKLQREQYLAARRLGLSDTAARARLKAVGVGNDRLEDITSGIYRPLTISKDAQRNAEQLGNSDRIREAEQAASQARERDL